ncbi:lipopolysaccharide biosynthesis protein [Dyella caseinilytica]|uniref:Oligosaccharide flippase family protein n=1 Tax=Dyella caseinilytica TaxID=1849581 RepID=A0ABX7GV99_9GAMM|nr:polysaccharide biosynthesis C-terminal domain-containing protein [Dyella caseinilytica]QRN54398.1 oligosaccharide flippase family protein [Dyella caseinilytica]GFZ93913.1 hypothetical protein GCM10011408_12120 [Dyella caseinilytica]
MKGQLALSSLKTTFWLGVRIVTQATVLVLLTRILGPQVFGNFSAIASLALIIGTLPTFGSGFVMLARRAQDANGIGAVWRYAWPTTLSVGIALLVVYVLIARLLTTPPLPATLLLMVGASELLLTPMTYLASYALQAREKVPLSQFVQWLPLSFRIVAAILCLSLEASSRLQTYVTLQLLTSFLATLLALAIAHHYVELNWRPRLVSRQELRAGAAYAAMNLVAANPSEIDKIVAIRLIGAHDTGIYATTTRVMTSCVTPVIGMLLSAQPRLFRHAHKPTHEGLRLIWVIALLSLGWGLISGIVLVLCSPLLPWLFGEAFVETAGLMPWLALSAPGISLRLAAGTILVALGKPIERLVFEVLGVLILVSSMVLLGPHYRAFGLAIALSFAESSMAIIGWHMVSKRLRAIGPDKPAPLTLG